MVNHLIEVLKKEYEEDEDFKFSKKFKDSGFVKEEIEFFLDLYEEHMATQNIEVLLNLAWFSLDRSVYSILNDYDENDIKLELSRAKDYAFKTIYYGAKSCKCFSGGVNIDMNRISLLFAINILCNKWENTKEMGRLLIDSLNAENCIIGRGLPTATRSWFLLDLFSFVSKIEIDKKRAIAPKNDKYEPFYDVLQDWDTDDENLIDKHITILCEYHLIYAASEIDYANREERMRNFEIPCFQIFPYEILAWLKLREQHGLKNPTEFSHDLMNTKIVKVFLELGSPLDEVEDLPFKKEVIANLKEACPEMKI